MVACNGAICKMFSQFIGNKITIEPSYPGMRDSIPHPMEGFTEDNMVENNGEMSLL